MTEPTDSHLRGWDQFQLDIDGVSFVTGYGRSSTADRFVIRKPEVLVEQTRTLIETLMPRRVVEIGLAAGGSFALIGLLADPVRFVGIEFESTPIAALTDFISKRALGERLRPHYGVDQADIPTLRSIVASEFGTEPLDLVIDDGSHEYHRTTATFNELFARLRPGGRYVIEDWSCDLKQVAGLERAIDDLDQHDVDAVIEAAAQANPNDIARAYFRVLLTGRPADAYTTIVEGLQKMSSEPDSTQRDQLAARLAEAPRYLAPDELERLQAILADFGHADLHTAVDGREVSRLAAREVPLARLTTELTYVAGTGSEIIRSLRIDEFWTEIERGPADLDPTTFHLADHLVEVDT